MVVSVSVSSPSVSLIRIISYLIYVYYIHTLDTHISIEWLHLPFFGDIWMYNPAQIFLNLPPRMVDDGWRAVEYSSKNTGPQVQGPIVFMATFFIWPGNCWNRTVSPYKKGFAILMSFLKALDHKQMMKRNPHVKTTCYTWYFVKRMGTSPIQVVFYAAFLQWR